MTSSRRITDPDVQLLAAISGGLESDYVVPAENDPWTGSPFAWIRNRPSRQKGKIGEQLVAGISAAKELDVIASGDSQADRVIAGKRIEIKTSMLWEGGEYVFQQFRDQNYEYAFCLGISPYTASAWVIPKSTIFQHAIPQHAGKAGSDTFWLRIEAASPPSWMSSWGGTLGKAIEVLRAAG